MWATRVDKHDWKNKLTTCGAPPPLRAKAHAEPSGATPASGPASHRLTFCAEAAHTPAVHAARPLLFWSEETPLEVTVRAYI